MAVVIGCDIGQRVDPTAIAVVETEWRDRTGLAAWEPVKRDDHSLVRHLERLPLGTPYPQVAERIAVVVQGVKARTRARPVVYLDATGVGQPVVDLIRALGVRATAVFFTHGDRRTVTGESVTLGKAYLVSRLQALLQSQRLHLPQTAEAQALAKELLDYEIKVGEDANDRYGAFKVGTHDDLVTALGLAVQVQPPPPSTFTGQPALSPTTPLFGYAKPGPTGSRLFGQPGAGQRTMNPRMGWPAPGGEPWP